MLVSNSEAHLRPAIESMLNQSFTDFEFIIVNDCSTDRSLEIIESFNDPRIIVINNTEKTTIAESRNIGIQKSRARFIASFDSDDIAHPDRLKVEVEFLESHPDFGLVGSFVRLIDRNGAPTGVKWAEKISSEKVPIRLLFGNCFAQSSVMIRKSALPSEGYGTGISEDYPLWIRIAQTWKVANLPYILLDYRVYDQNNTSKKKELLHAHVNEILRSQLQKLGIDASPEELIIHRTNYTYKGTKTEVKDFIAQREAWLIKLSLANHKTHIYDTKMFNEVMAERLLTTLGANTGVGFYGWNILIQSPLTKYLNLTEEWKNSMKFFVKSLFN